MHHNRGPYNYRVFWSQTAALCEEQTEIYVENIPFRYSSEISLIFFPVNVSVQKELVFEERLSSGNMHFGSGVRSKCAVSVSVHCFKSVCVCVCLVSAENLEKCLRQMEKHLLQLEKDLDTFSTADNQQDLFHSKMAISFHICMYIFYV